MKLTALFTARRGRSFLASLLAREGRNYSLSSFVRLRYFNRLVEQYPKVLHPNKAMLEQLKNHMQEGARWMTLAARNHAKWERNKWEKDKRRQDDQCIPVAWASQPQ
jgi:splicing factor 3A subunit 1